MKKKIMLIGTLSLAAVLLLPRSIHAQDDKEKDILSECDKAKSEFIKVDPSMSKLFEESYGYAIFPKAGKGGLIVGGGGGNGGVYEKGKEIGTAKMAQLSVGA